MSLDFPLNEPWPGTPFPHLLLSNDLPSETERLLILSLVHDYEQDIINLREELSALHSLYWGLVIQQIQAPDDTRTDKTGRTGPPADPEATLESLFATKRAMEETILGQLQYLIEGQKRHQGVLSAIRKLPSELLVEILMLACPKKRPFHTRQTTDIDFDFGLMYNYDYGFTQVCSRWREICLSTPWLWTEIPTISEVFRGDRVSGYTRLICAFLERSKDLPIDVVISIQARELNQLSDLSEYYGWASPIILRLLLDAAHRWKSAVLFLHEDIFSFMPELHFPVLERLNMRSLGKLYMVAGSLDFPHHVFAKTPMLRTLISDGQYDSQNLEPPVPFRGIAEFVGLPSTSIDLKDGESTLVECTFRGPLSRVALFPQDSLAFSELKRLRVINNNYQHPHHFGSPDGTIFQCMEAPSLEHLVVEGHPVVEEAVMIISHLVGKTLQAPSLLKSLTLHIAGITKESLVSILEVTPLLEKLDIYDAASIDWNDLVLQPQCDENAGDTSLAPHLQSLVLRRGCGEDLAGLYAIYQSRSLSRTSQSEEDDEGGFSVTVAFPNHSALLRGLSHTAGWNEKSYEEWTHPPKGSEHTLLQGWAMFLMKNFLDWFGVRRSGLKLKGKKTTRSLFRNWCPSTEGGFGLMTFFAIVENYIVNDARLLEITGILYVMDRVARIDKHKLWFIENANVESIQPRAMVIVDRWKAQLRSRKGDMPQTWKVLEDGLTIVSPNDTE